jgi:hypothetical protein
MVKKKPKTLNDTQVTSNLILGILAQKLSKLLIV